MKSGAHCPGKKGVSTAMLQTSADLHTRVDRSSALGLLTTCVTPATFDGGYLPRRHMCDAPLSLNTSVLACMLWGRCCASAYFGPTWASSIHPILFPGVMALR